MRYAGEQPIEMRDPNLVAAVPVIVPIAKGIGLMQKGYWANRATGATGTASGDGTLDAAIERGEMGLEREAAIRMQQGYQGQPSVGNGAVLF